MKGKSPGPKLVFRELRGRRPVVATFSLERLDNGVPRIVDILHVLQSLEAV